MATAKQLAWRKKFAAMAKAGTLKKKSKRNPAAKKAAPAKRAVSRVVSRANPVKRKVAVKRATSSGMSHAVSIQMKDGWKRVALFPMREFALVYARALANAKNKPVRLEKL